MVFGIVGAVTCLVYIRERERNRFGWMAFSILLAAVWVVGTFGFWVLRSGFYLWGGLFAALLILYWQFYLQEEVRNGNSASSRSSTVE